MTDFVTIAHDGRIVGRAVIVLGDDGRWMYGWEMLDGSVFCGAGYASCESARQALMDAVREWYQNLQ